MKFRCNNLLVTGGSGFIGSNFIEYILKKYKNLKVYNLDNLTYAGNVSNTKQFNNNKDYTFIKGNICDGSLLNDVFSQYKIDGVINFAAESHVDNSINNPNIFVKTNVLGVLELMKAACNFWMDKNHIYKKEFQSSRFHQISTDEVYGSINKGSFKEGDNYRPNSPYSASKGAADLLVRSFNKTYGLNTTISISSNNFGKNQNNEKFIPKILDCISSNFEIPVYGNGTNIRDWISVEDNCSAIDLIFNNSKSGEKFNVGANNELTNLELIKIISKIMSMDPKINFIEDRKGHDFRYSLDTKKIRKELNWVPKNNFKNSLKNYIKYYKGK